MGGTRQEVEQKAREAVPEARILDCQPIRLDDIPLRAKVPPHWVVVVDGASPSQFPVEDDPVATKTAEVRSTYMQMVANPEAMSTGMHAEFNCPACGDRVAVDLAPPTAWKERSVARTQCPQCGADLFKEGPNAWLENR